MPRPLSSLTEIRDNINLIDTEIIKLLANRYQYVRLAAKFKSDSLDVADDARVRQVINRVKLLADEHNLPSIVAESVYTSMVNCFISLEQREFERLNKIDKNF